MTYRRKISVALVLSAVLCILCLVLVPIICIFLPSVVSTYLTEHEPTLMQHITLILTVYYVAAAVATAVLLLLLALLRVTYRGEVFTPVSGRLVYVIASLVIAEGGVIAVLGTVYPPVLMLTVVAVVLGLCLLVVGNVFRQAAEIKAENDATI